MFSKSFRQPAQKKLSKWVTPRAPRAPRAVLRTPGASTSSSRDSNLYVGGHAVAKHSSVFAGLGGLKIVAIHIEGLGLTKGAHYEVKGGLTLKFRKIPGRVVKPTIFPAPNRTFFVMESDIVSTGTINTRYAAKQKSLAEKKNRKVHFPSPPVTNEHGASDTSLPSGESTGSAPSSQGSPPGDDWGTPSPENNPNNCIQVFRRKKESLYRADQDVVPPVAGMTYVGETDSETESEISDNSDDDSDDSDDSDAPASPKVVSPATPVRCKRKRGVVLFDPEAPLPPILFRKRKRKSAERLTVKTFRGKDNLKPEPTFLFAKEA